MGKDIHKTSHIDQYIGRQIMYWRKERGMSRKNLAEILGITHQQLQKYEAGANRIASSRLKLLADILKCPVEVFFPAIGDKMAQGMVENATEGFVAEPGELLDITDAAIAKKFAQLKSPKVKKVLSDLLETLKGEGC